MTKLYTSALYRCKQDNEYSIKAWVQQTLKCFVPINTTAIMHNTMTFSN